MDTSALKSFAPEARRRLLEAVERKLDFVLTGDTADLRAAAAQVERLRAQAETGRAQLIERVAYTWFNRLAALRFLDARGWHPFRVRVLTPASPQETQPEILRLMRTGVLPEELRAHTDPARLNDLLDGRLPSFDPHAEVYRHLVLAACRFYHALLPFLFERLDDETELLLPDDLLTEHSVAQGFRTEISDEDCAEVEVLGWLYQFYISEKKDQVMARKAAVASEDIPAVTQLFTPHWIVRYLVENSLGRLWLRSRPGSALRETMPYYVDDPDGQAPADSLTVSRPEEIRLLDPACGSGHMLTYAFDLLFQIYEEEGHAPGEIAEKILTHNLYGLEICPRATQLAQFALLAKARERSTSAFREAVQPQVMCLQDVVFDPDELRSWRDAGGLAPLITENVLKQLHQFREDTATFGSLIQPVLDAGEIGALKDAIVHAPPPTDLLLEETLRKVLLAFDQAEMLSQRYHVVVTNPPYMGAGAMNSSLKDFVGESLNPGKQDSYSAFILRDLQLVSTNGFVAMVTIPNWMFLSKFGDLREIAFSTSDIISLVHIGRGVWGSDFGSCAFVLQSAKPSGRKGKYKRLFKRQGEVQSNDILHRNFFDHVQFPSYEASVADFKRIPNAPIAYWLTPSVLSSFRFPKIEQFCEGEGKNVTADNDRFMRYGWEISIGTLGRGRKWLPYAKGGPFRKWAGNVENVVNWSEEALAFYRSNNSSRLITRDFWYREGITWTDITSTGTGFRYLPKDATFDTAGLTIFITDQEELLPILGLLNSRYTSDVLPALNPTLHANFIDIKAVPVVPTLPLQVADLVREAINIAQTDWDNFETSWDFRDQPLLRPGLKGATLEASWRNWEAQGTAAIRRMQELETENNRLFIGAYGLDGELQPEVPEAQITLARAEARRDMAAFLSYAVGCMMGRYSPDHPGLILANAGDTLREFLDKVGKPLAELTFAPDEDGIIPVLDGEWFEDDIVARTRDFLRATFGDAALEENLRFIEESLGKDLRRYFITDFYKDHLQTYKKRPIYWLFQSPKKGFQCLVYLHRFTRDTPNLVLNRYLREYLAKIGYRLEHLDHVVASESTAPRERTQARRESDDLRKTLRECEEWEREVLLPLAQQRLDLDLDDGVKVNYLKLGKALAPIPGLAGKGGDA